MKNQTGSASRTRCVTGAWVLVACLLMFLTDTGAAEAPNPCPPTTPPAQVKEVYRARFVSGVETEKKPFTAETPARLGEVVTIRVDNLGTLREAARCAGNKKIVLFLDDRPLTDRTTYPPSDPGASHVHFVLARAQQSIDTWTHILGTPTLTPRPTKISLGLEDGHAVSSAVTIPLEIIPTGWLVLWLVIFVGLVIAFLLLARKSDLLRASGPATTGASARKPYSLSRTQAAWWFFIVLASYLFIGLITGDFSTTITPAVLGLLGISGGTAIGSAIVDSRKSTEVADAQRQAISQTLSDQITALDETIEDTKVKLQVDPKDPAALTALAQASATKAASESSLKKANVENEVFWLDIVSDADGVSFPRFQMAAWTIVLGIVFVIGVYKSLAMPNFDAALLTLLGISAGTYLGLKVPEPTVPTKK